MPTSKGQRALRGIVWAGRSVGWILIAIAILNALSFRGFGLFGSGFRLVSSVALGLVGIVWIIGLELFLRFFDRYLSRN